MAASNETSFMIRQLGGKIFYSLANTSQSKPIPEWTRHAGIEEDEMVVNNNPEVDRELKLQRTSALQVLQSV